MRVQRFLAARLGSGSATMRRSIIIVMVLVAVPTMATATEIMFTPSQPQIGETITFRIIGASGSVSGVRWSFGEAACPDSGFANPSTCSLPDYFDCLIQGFSYPTAGVKDVTLSFKVDGMSQPSLELGPLSISPIWLPARSTRSMTWLALSSAAVTTLLVTWWSRRSQVRSCRGSRPGPTPRPVTAGLGSTSGFSTPIEVNRAVLEGPPERPRTPNTQTTLA